MSLIKTINVLEFKIFLKFLIFKLSNFKFTHPNITYFSLFIKIKSDAFFTLESNFLIWLPIPLLMICSTRFLKSIGISYCFQRSLSSAKLSTKKQLNLLI